MLNQFTNLSCYEEFEIQCVLAGISKIDVLKRIGYKTTKYYFFMSEDGIFNWFDLEGNHIEDPGILKKLKEDYILSSISKCIIPNSVTVISDSAFSCCKSLKEIVISNSVTVIGERAFSRCDSLKEIVIPNSVIVIGEWTFYCCESLKEITISNSVSSIGYKAFSHCYSLKEIVFKGKTLEEVKQMANYPFGIEDESVFKFS